MGRRNKTQKTHDPKLRWYVVEIDHNEQNKGGKFGKRRIISNPLRRERAERLLNHCVEYENYLVETWDSKNCRTFELEVADEN